MSEKKIIAVVGATGAQGSGLVRAIAANPQGPFVARALTRDVNSEKAREFKQLGVEVVAADLDDRASIERAFAGAYGAFCITFFWHHFSPERELVEAEMMADVARAAGLKHVIWSTLEDTRKKVPLEDTRMPTLMGNYKVPHWDAKGEADRFFRDRSVPTTFLVTSFYYENFIFFGLGPKPDAQGNLAITFPIGSTRLSCIGSEDIGRCAYGIFEGNGQFVGRTIGIAGEHLTGAQMADRLSQALGVHVRFNDVSPDAYRALGFPGADDLGNMFQFDRDFEADCCAARSIDESRALNPALADFDSWLAHNKSKIPLES